MLGFSSSSCKGIEEKFNVHTAICNYAQCVLFESNVQAPAMCGWVWLKCASLRTVFIRHKIQNRVQITLISVSVSHVYSHITYKKSFESSVTHTLHTCCLLVCRVRPTVCTNGYFISGEITAMRSSRTKWNGHPCCAMHAAYDAIMGMHRQPSSQRLQLRPSGSGVSGPAPPRQRSAHPARQ